MAQLNHFSPDMRAAQLADLRTIASHCDGVRCDMAMLQLNEIFAQHLAPHCLATHRAPSTEFWTDVRANVPNLALLAEAYWGTEQRLLDLGFSFAYDKTLYDAVRRRERYRGTRPHLRQPRTSNAILHASWKITTSPGGLKIFSNERLAADGTLFGTLPGMRFYHQGELEGRRIRPADHATHRRRRAARSREPGVLSENTADHATRCIPRRRMGAARTDPEGDPSPYGLVVYEWRSANVMESDCGEPDGDTSQGRLRLGDRVSPVRQYIFYDELNDVTYLRSGEELHNVGLFIRRDGFQAHLFNVTTAP